MMVLQIVEIAFIAIVICSLIYSTVKMLQARRHFKRALDLLDRIEDRLKPSQEVDGRAIVSDRNDDKGGNHE